MRNPERVPVEMAFCAETLSGEHNDSKSEAAARKTPLRALRRLPPREAFIRIRLDSLDQTSDSELPLR